MHSIASEKCIIYDTQAIHGISLKEALLFPRISCLYGYMGNSEGDKNYVTTRISTS